jgi:D-galactarolactone cycloisomerase
MPESAEQGLKYADRCKSREPEIRIRSIRSVSLSGQSPKGGWALDIEPQDSIHSLIAVHTTAGISGYGSVFADGRLVEAGLAVLEPLYRAEDALQPERVSEKLHQNTFWMGRGGTLTHVISGIDLALWDILGKFTGLPVAMLLGGRYRERVQPYCSLLMEEPFRMANAIGEHRAKGFRAFKIGWGPFGRGGGHKIDEDIVKAARTACGDDARLMVDAGASDAYWQHGLKWATRTADMLRDHDVYWFEEPLKPDALEDYRVLRQASTVQIAGGEVLTRRQSFVPWLAQGALDIVQPDVTKVGGLSEQRRIAWLAQHFDVKYIGHGWNTAVGLAADLQMAAAMPDTDMVEYISDSPYLNDIAENRFQLDDDGYLAIPATPGLGVSLDKAKIAQYTSDAAPLFEDK